MFAKWKFIKSFFLIKCIFDKNVIILFNNTLGKNILREYIVYLIEYFNGYIFYKVLVVGLIIYVTMHI